MNKKLIVVLIPILVLMIALLGILGFLLVSEGDKEEVYLEQIQIARKCLSNGDYDNAILYYKNAIAEDKTQEEPYLALADIYYSGKSDLHNAIWILREGFSNTGSVRIQEAITKYQLLLDGGSSDAINPSDNIEVGGNVNLNSKMIDIIYTYTYKDYMNQYSVEREQASSGVYTVSYTQFNATFEYKESAGVDVIDPSTDMPYNYSRPSAVRFDYIGDIIVGVENGVTEETLKAIGCSNIKRNPANSTVGSEYYTFTYSYCSFIVACDGNGVITPEGYNVIVPPVGEKVIENVAVSGKVYDVNTSSIVSSASITFRKGHNNTSDAKKTVTNCNRNGEYSVMLAPGKYTATVSASDYRTKSFNITVPQNPAFQQNFAIEHKPIPTTAPPTQPAPTQPVPSTVTVSGTVVDVTTGSVISSANLVFREGHDKNSGSSVASARVSNGTYTVSIEAGNYTVEISANGYNKEYANITVPEGRSYEQNFSISPVMQSEQIRIVLEWGANPSDLDSHLQGLTASGRSIHVYFGNGRATDNNETIAELDVDDTSGFGPETITINNTSGSFEYWVDHFSGTGSIATSGVTVKVYQGNSSQPMVITVPEGFDGREWSVFRIENGNIVDINGVVN
ncbi:MAG: carboxypeptidase regulatory-like domain-containing protein [Ruminococcus sp.]|nr:carboxypeptidase regulatory-like domain-containing protein [Ruminococcus sp.]